MVCERSLEHWNDVYICFVDFEKAFDRVNWVRMMETPKGLGKDITARRKIQQLYMNQTAVVRVVDGESEPGVIGRRDKDVRCPPLLFSIYAEAMMIETLEENQEGVMVGGINPRC